MALLIRSVPKLSPLGSIRSYSEVVNVFGRRNVDTKRTEEKKPIATIPENAVIKLKKGKTNFLKIILFRKVSKKFLLIQRNTFLVVWLKYTYHPKMRCSRELTELDDGE